MATKPWPVELPDSALVQGLQDTYIDNRISSPNDIGPDKSRPRFTDQMRIVSCAVILDEEQATVLEQFYEEELFHGTGKFSWKPGLDMHGQFLFMEAPEKAYLSKSRWKFSFKLLRLRDVPTDIAAAFTLHQLVHDELVRESN